MHLRRKHAASGTPPVPRELHALCLDASVGEYLLFHGCPENAVQPILKNGFDFRLAGSGAGTLFGRGTYFQTPATHTMLTA